MWAALPGARHWAEAIVAACEPVLAAGRGAVVVVPDRRDADVLEGAVTDRFGPDRHARLEADLGAAARYRSFLACLRGEVRLAIGTRSAAFAPVHDLALVVIWDDGDDSHVEPRAPYPHVREVLRLRAEQGEAAMLVGGWAVTAESAAWLRSGWARPIEADRTTRRLAWPRVLVEQDAAGPAAAPVSRTGLPSGAWRVLKRGLTTGPVLVQVPLTGYLPAVSCQTCRRPARCPQCAGPVQVDAEGVTSCGWCARRLVPWVCPSCEGTSLRARQTGALRSVEELGRSFPGVPVVLSRAGHTPRVGDRSAIVVATGGVEPPAEKGYAAAALLDGDLVLARPDLRAGEEALRRWLAAAALVRPATEGGEVVVGADPAAPAVQALVRVDPTGFADRELAQRSELDLPPASATISLEGDPAAVAAVVRHVSSVEFEQPQRVDVLGPIPLPVRRREPEKLLDSGFELDPDPVRVLLRSRPEGRAALAAAVRDAVRSRSARREAGALRVRVDPVDLG